MLIRVFKSNFPGLIAGLFIILSVFWLDAFFHIKGQIVTHDDKALLYNYFLQIFIKYPFLNLGVSLLFTLINALIVSNIISNFDLLPKKTYLPALIYIVFMSSHNELTVYNPAIFSSFFLLIMIQRVFKTYSKPDDLIEILNIGVLCGLASLFYLPAIFYIVFAWIALVIFQFFSARRLIITIIGFSTPYIFISVFLFLFNKFDFTYIENYYYAFSFPKFEHFSELTIPEYLLIAYCFFIIAASFFTGILRLQEKIIRTRKMFTIGTWFFIITVLVTIFSSNMLISIAFATLPLSLFIPNYLLQIKKKIYSELWFTILVAIIIIHKLNLFF